jgi:ubiquinone/menaquinone biosynthesis C-methylase UbiE
MSTPRDAAAETARAYDRWFDAPWGRHAFAVERAALVDAVGPLTGRTLLDVGCGTGRFAAALVDAGAQVTGVDRNAGMLAVAAGRVDAPLLRADAHRLPFADGCFDVVVAVTLLEFADRPQEIVDELVRVARPDGRVAVAVLNPRSPWGLAHRRRLRRPPWSRACLRTRAELAALLAGHGRVRLHAALYAPGAVPGLDRIGPAVETLGGVLPAAGAFQVGVLALAHAQSRPHGR